MMVAGYFICAIIAISIIPTYYSSHVGGSGVDLGTKNVVCIHSNTRTRVYRIGLARLFIRRMNHRCCKATQTDSNV